MSPPAQRGPGAGGAWSLDELYHTQSARLVAQLYSYTQDLALAEDLVQEAFCRAVAHWSRLAEYDDPVGWIRRVAWNLAASNWRRRRSFRLFAGGAREDHTPEPSLERVVLVQALAKLPLVPRRVVIMFYLADMSLAEIAEFEGISENAVKQRLHRARAALTAELTEPQQEVGHA